MDFEKRNWILAKISGFYKVLSLNYPEFYEEILVKANVPIDSNNTAINWLKLNQELFQFNYEIINDRSQVSDWLSKSDLKKYDELVVEFGPDQPIINVQMKAFIDNWYDFASYRGFDGILLFTADARLVLEFGDRRTYNLYSNFRIMPAL